MNNLNIHPGDLLKNHKSTVTLRNSFADNVQWQSFSSFSLILYDLWVNIINRLISVSSQNFLIFLYKSNNIIMRWGERRLYLFLNFLSQFSDSCRLLTAGGGGGGPSTVTDLCRGWGGQNSQLKIISSTCKPSPSHICGGGMGGLIWAAVGRPQQSDGSFFSNFPTAQGNNANNYLICM